MEINMRDGGGTYPNLFCGHPPFQIDGNFGGTAGIAEMLLQSNGEDEVIRLLPALPGNPDWQEGSISGLKARGDFEISMRWKNGAITEAGLVSSRGGKCKLLLPANKIIKDAKGKIVAYAGQEKKVVEFNTAPGGRYRIL
jgi:alpha-L-fucosidase 2